MVEKAQLKPGPGFQPLRAACYYGQRLVVEPRLRRLVSRALATMVRVTHPDESPSSEPTVNGERHHQLLQALKVDGYSIVPPVVTADDLAEMASFLQDQPLSTKAGHFTAREIPPGTTLGDFPASTVLACPHVLRIANDPAILKAVAAYIGCKPTISQIGIRWSFPVARTNEYTQQFHRDYDDWRFVKLFVYLRDVDEQSGPHVYVAGSHHGGGRLRARLFSDAEIEQRWSVDHIRTITGPAGTSFFVDTYGIHKGIAPLSRPRLMLQIQYSLLPVLDFKYTPLAMSAPCKLDRYINRLLIQELPSTPND